MYKYNYDDLNRLELATYENLSVTNVEDTYNERLIYDKNGNITSLVRNGGFENSTEPLCIDELVYTYQNTTHSNQLKKVVDLSASTQGFKDGGSGDDYTYDAFGNMTQDNNKNITHISYNHLNLPKKISFTNNNYIAYTYDASGIKVKKYVLENNTVSITDYLDGYQYNNNKLQFFPHAEGYVKHILVGANDDISIFEYVYQYKDHLGNIRVNYAFSKGAIYILDEHHYYPFGLEHGKYNREKKEFRKQEVFSINNVFLLR